MSEGAYGFVPVAEEEMKELADYMLPYLSDRTCCVLQDPQGAIVAFCITLPSMSRALKAAHGSRFLFNLLYKRRALRNYQVMDLLLEGALPEWRDKGVLSQPGTRHLRWPPTFMPLSADSRPAEMPLSEKLVSLGP